MKNELAYDQGFQAYHDGMDLEDNPNDEGTDEYSDWETGWVTASAEDSKNDPF